MDASQTLHVTVLLPGRELDPSLVNEELLSYNKASDSSPTIFLALKVHRSRVLWRALEPWLFQSKRRTTRYALSCILHSVHWRALPTTQQQHDSEQVGSDNVLFSETNEISTFIRRRQLRVGVGCTSATASTKAPQTKCARVVLWIEPAMETPLEDAFMGRLIAWEHKLIRATSMSGFLATLGGGFFMCHHFRTAIFLAQEQQRMALLLNDHGMHARCMLNTAYNFVYAGHFRFANKLIRRVWEKAKVLKPPDPVLVSMCYSARLFSKRMMQASKRDSDGIIKKGQTPGVATVGTKNGILDESKAVVLSKTIDDFSRIRIVKDQSMEDDLVIPFGNHNLVHLYSESV
jgi:hypothetical protein